MFHYLIGPAVGAVIGCFTNYIAIRMMFRPHTAKYFMGIHIPFTPGIIPKEKSRIASSIGKAVSENLMNREVLEKSLLSPEMLEKMIHLGPRDALVAISYPRYSKSIINAVDLAKKKQARIIAVTDSADSPIAKAADVRLLAQSDMASFADSLVAPLSILNALVAIIGKLREDAVSTAFGSLERMWDEYDVYDEE